MTTHQSDQEDEVAKTSAHPHPERSLRSRVQSGLAWKLASEFVVQSSRIVVLLVLARLLTPREYGLAGMVLVFSGFTRMFVDLAFGAALVQRRTLTEEDRSTVFWMTLALGVVLTFVGVGLSGPLASFYGEPAVKPLFMAYSITFLINSLRTTQASLLLRDMKFRSLEVRSMAGYVAGAIAGIAVALAGYGAWAIIFQQLALGVVSTVLVWRFSDWRPHFVFSSASLRSLGGFSSKVFGTNVLFYINRNADNLLIGRFLGPAALGVYALGYNVILIPYKEVASSIQAVLFPAFARLKDDRERMAAAWLRVNCVIAAGIMPSFAALVIVAPDLVPTVFGQRWTDATPVIQILAWVGLLQALQRLNGSILQACDRAGALLVFAIISFAASIAAFFIGLQWGIVGVAAAYAVATTGIQPLYAWLTARAAGLRFWDLVANLSGVVQASLVMIACVLATRYALVHEGVPAGARLLIEGAVAVAVYVPLCVWREPVVLEELRGLRRRVRRGQPLTSRPTATPSPSEP